MSGFVSSHSKHRSHVVQASFPPHRVSKAIPDRFDARSTDGTASGTKIWSPGRQRQVASPPLRLPLCGRSRRARLASQPLNGISLRSPTNMPSVSIRNLEPTGPKNKHAGPNPIRLTHDSSRKISPCSSVRDWLRSVGAQIPCQIAQGKLRHARNLLLSFPATHREASHAQLVRNLLLRPVKFKPELCKLIPRHVAKSNTMC
jgi:hypothetical protein